MVEGAKSRLCDNQFGKINEKVENFISPMKETRNDTDGEMQTEFQRRRVARGPRRKSMPCEKDQISDDIVRFLGADRVRVEKLVFNQLYHYLDNDGLLSANQSGFRRLHSTVTCLLKNTDDWYTGLDSGQMLGMVFVDLKKAFDTVDHRVLCNKLELHGVQQRELSWVESYLTNRKQYCCAGGYDSKMGEVEIGVPQGSCMYVCMYVYIICHD